MTARPRKTFAQKVAEIEADYSLASLDRREARLNRTLEKRAAVANAATREAVRLTSAWRGTAADYTAATAFRSRAYFASLDVLNAQLLIGEVNAQRSRVMTLPAPDEETKP